MKFFKAKCEALRQALSVPLAIWLLDRSLFGRSYMIKRLAGHLLKMPARHGSIAAQRRLGQLLYQDCPNRRDRRIGLELLQQAARAGDSKALQMTLKLSDSRELLRLKTGRYTQGL